MPRAAASKSDSQDDLPHGWRVEAALKGILLLMTGMLASCANPVRPSGGPPDQTPPRIVTSRPGSEDIGVSGRTMQILFDEYVDRESLQEALSVTPRPSGRLDFDWDGRSVEITFPEPFRDSTTYLLVIDNSLQDVRGVAIEQPIQLAFSTGDQIDRGRLTGRVVGNARGAAREGFDVYAYPASVADSARLPERPLYRTQTGPDGTFAFAYLRENQRYYIAALRDQNRNRRPDPLEAFAAAPRPFFTARAGAQASGPADAEIPGAASARAPRDTTRGGAADRDTLSGPSLVAAREDPISPRLTRALPLSRRRLALRFNEPVRLRARTPEFFVLTDTVAGRRVAVNSVYQQPGQGQRLTLRTAPMETGGHRVQLSLPNSAGGASGRRSAVTDTSGNTPERPAEAAFTAPERADTLALRFLRFEKSKPAFPTAGQDEALALVPGQVPVVVFNQPPGSGAPPDSAAADSAARRLVTARDTATGAALPFRLETSDGTTYRIAFDPPLASGQTVRLSIDARRFDPPADTTYARLFRRLPDDALGAVSGVVQRALPDSAAAAVYVELYPAEAGARAPLRTVRAEADGRFVFEQLPEASYRYRAFLDRDGDGTWDAGRLAPWRPPEALVWSRQPVEARPRWETATEDTLRLRDVRPSTAD